MTLNFKEDGDYIYLLGKSIEDINSSQYLVHHHQREDSSCPYFNLNEEYLLQNTLHKINEAKLARSMHDCSEGGLFITLLESAMAGDKGFEICYDHLVREDAFLFGECQSRVVVSIAPENKIEFENILNSTAITYSLIGKVLTSQIQVKTSDWGPIEDWKKLYDEAIEKELSQ